MRFINVQEVRIPGIDISNNKDDSHRSEISHFCRYGDTFPDTDHSAKSPRKLARSKARPWTTCAGRRHYRGLSVVPGECRHAMKCDFKEHSYSLMVIAPGRSSDSVSGNCGALRKPRGLGKSALQSSPHVAGGNCASYINKWRPLSEDPTA